MCVLVYVSVLLWVDVLCGMCVDKTLSVCVCVCVCDCLLTVRCLIHPNHHACLMTLGVREMSYLLNDNSSIKAYCLHASCVNAYTHT